MIEDKTYAPGDQFRYYSGRYYAYYMLAWVGGNYICLLKMGDKPKIWPSYPVADINNITCEEIVDYLGENSKVLNGMVQIA